MSGRLPFEARRLEFAYAGGPTVVRDISFEIAPASMTAVIGANGSGKSTLIRMLAGLLRPRSGEVLLDGIPLRKWDGRLRAREIAYVPQSTLAAFPFRAIEVVLTGRTPYGSRFGFESEQDRARALEALALVGAEHLAERPLTSLSGGERQMVIVARALAQEPRFLLLDEPASWLDLKHRAALLRALMELKKTKQLAVVMITHDLHMTGSMFDQVLALRCGEMAARGRPEEVLQSHILRGVYDDPNVHAQRIGGQTMVWIEP